MVMRFLDPFETLLNLQRALESVRSSDWFGIGTTGRGEFPPINVFQKGDEFVVITEIPGVHKSDLQIKVKDGQLQISGKKEVDYGGKASLHRRERLSGSFDRSISFPTDITRPALRPIIATAYLQSLFRKRKAPSREISKSIDGRASEPSFD
jgi:HSP20 family protein